AAAACPGSPWNWRGFHSAFPPLQRPTLGTPNPATSPRLLLEIPSRHDASYGITQIICKSLDYSSTFAYDLGMVSLAQFIDEQLIRGRAYFTRKDVSAALSLKPKAQAAAITRLIKKRRLANPRHGFFLILRPEDQRGGAPDPVQWIDPLMKHQGLNYRVSLLR